MQAARGARSYLPCALIAGGLAALIATPLRAQNLGLDRLGGGLGDVVSFPLQGQPNEGYVVLLDLIEQSTPVPALGVTLDITDQFAWFSLNAPTFAGVTDNNGAATATALVPNIPFFQGLVFSLQAIAGNGPYRVSNLVRYTPQVPGTFAPTLQQPPVPILAGGTATAPNNELLFVGGSGPAAQRYRSRTEDWQAAGTTFGVGLFSQTTGLGDGRILFTGGIDPTTGQTTANAAVYDPVAQTTTTLTMGSPRAGHGASLMGNGRVLVTGGLSALDLQNPLSLFTGLLVSTEIFDPVTNTFAPGPNMLEARGLHTSTTLTNGQVLIAGGLSLLPIVSIPTVSATAYRFNPATGSFGLPALFSGGRFLHAAAPLTGGRVLLVGGISLDLTTFLQTLNPLDIIFTTRTDCQVYTPVVGSFGTFATVNGMQIGRASAAVAPLPNGGALIAGGFELAINPTTSTFQFVPTATADLFSSSPNAIAPTGSMAQARVFPLSANLPDGTIMVLGGGVPAEVYQR
ncbi:MAG TPA: kelch repeat-containing protein [Planctomycetota bacterium]